MIGIEFGIAAMQNIVGKETKKGGSEDPPSLVEGPSYPGLFYV